MDTISHLVHAVGLDPHVIGSEVPADFGEILLVILWRDRGGCGVADRRLGKAEEVTHVVNKGLVLEGLDGEAIHAGNKHLVESLLVHGLAHLMRQLFQLLDLLAVELFDIGGGRWGRGRRRCWPPHVGSDGVGKGGGKLKLAAGILDGEVDSGLHFGPHSWTWCDPSESVFGKSKFPAENGFPLRQE